MSRTIHGRSTAALKHLRKAPAALAVYWCYVARMNNEGVAWPSARGLENDTGWNKATCLEGRALLAELGALEAVDGYIRPEWRSLAPAQLAQKKNLSKAEYYRPTGKLTADGKVYHLLYNGADDTNTIDTDVLPERTPEASADVLPDLTSSAVGVQPGSTELNSSIHLDSIESKLDSKDSAPVGAGASKSTKHKASENSEQAKAIVALIEAWLTHSGTIQPTAYKNKTIRVEAAAMLVEGITPKHIEAYIKTVRADRFWANKAISWYKLKGEILNFAARYKPVQPPPKPKASEEDQPEPVI